VSVQDDSLFIIALVGT